ncbi:MAG: DUF305 domain-containing protein [Gemmatimonadota bacterium]
MRKSALSLLAGSLLVGAAGCGQTAREPVIVTPAPGGVAAAAAVSDSVRSSYTPADAAFMTGMIHHHAQALVMSAMAPTHGASPALQTMAARIINGQKDEIALMQQWLRDQDLPVTDPAAGGMDAPMHGGHHDMQMAGMLSAEQLANLDAARGEEFDRLYLTYMIQHHQGAIIMVDELLATDGAAQNEMVFKLASDIGADQSSEIERMRTMLIALLFGDGGSLHPPTDRTP